MTGRERRAVWVGAAILAAAVLLRTVPLAARAVASMRQRLDDRTATLARAGALISAAPALHDSLVRSLAAFVGLAPSLLEGRTRAEASANLASLVSLVASRSAMRVVQQSVTPDSAVATFGRVTVRAELEGDVAGLTRLLAAMETSRPLLTVGTLAVDAPDPQPHAGLPERLRIEMEVTGWFQPRADP
jgi:hypothetical protein